MHPTQPSTLIPPQQLLRYMPGVQHQRQELRLIEAAWDNLSLLSSLSTLSARSSSGSDLAQARRDFAALSEEMMDGLAGEALKTALDDLGERAQMCIDILVRNLFERTADIGFFATDVVVAEFLAQDSADQRPAMENRLRDYASKYTVYSNILLFDAAAQLQASLAPAATAAVDADDAAFLTSVLRSREPYTEHYAVHGFCDPARPSLVYAQPVLAGQRPCGVLALQFKLEDESAAIFAQVRGDLGQGRDGVLAIVNTQGDTIHSSDALQLPVGWPLPQAARAGSFVLRHMGRKYMVVVRDSQGFQGYAGPGWRGLAMLPLDTAFDAEEDDAPSALMTEVASSAGFLSGALGAIPQRSAAIQSALERSVWNGLLELNQLAAEGSRASANDLLFARTLLSQIGATAQKTAQAFANTLHDLHKVVMQAQLQDTHNRAELAMQILDRNLYERANDCRWWALTPQFATTLVAQDVGCPSATSVLKQINSLYTVYTCLVLFDRQGRVMAVSDPAQAQHVGRTLDEPWVAQTLRLASSQDYAVSRYSPSCFYAAGPTYVYGAAVRDPRSAQGPVIGGIGIVWDGTAQMQSILHDCADGMGAQDVLAFVDDTGQVLHACGSEVLADQRTANLAAQARDAVVDLQGQLYGVGHAPGRGYREFGRSDGYAHGLRCLALRHLCARQPQVDLPFTIGAAASGRTVPAEHQLQLATFTIGGHWLGVDSRLIVKAAPDTVVLAAGNARPPVLGVSHVGNSVYPVVDLRSVVADVATPLSRDADPSRQLLVLRLPADAEQSRREFALRVDTLGSMIDIDSRQLQMLRTGSAAGAVPLIDAALSVARGGSTQGQAGTQALLCRISAAWLQQCLVGTSVDLEPQDLGALAKR